MIQSVREALKGAAELVLVGSGAAARTRRRNADRIAVLAYHNVVPRDATGRGDASLHLGLDAFRRQLDRLEETHRVVELAAVGGEGGSGRRGEADGGSGAAPAGGGRASGAFGARATGGRTVERSGPGRSAAAAGGGGADHRPAAALSFDDAYRGALRHAIPELVRRGLPATVFVCPGLLGEEGFWWDRIADTPSGPAPARRAEALGRLAGRHEAVLEAFGGGPVPDDHRPAAVDEVRALAGQPGITVASHTWSHPNLTAVAEPDLRDELVRSGEWLSDELGDAFLPGHLTLPYGLGDDRVVAAAHDAGYRFLYRVEGGPAHPGADGGVFPRINVPAGVSLRGFELRTAGVLG